MKVFGIALIILGILIFLGALGLIPMGFWTFILWMIALGFGISGALNMARMGFPKGLTSLGGGILIALILLKVINMGFWAFILAIAGLALIQWGIQVLMDRFKFKIETRF